MSERARSGLPAAPLPVRPHPQGHPCGPPVPGPLPSPLLLTALRAPRRPLTFEGEPDAGRGGRRVLGGGGGPGPGHQGSPEEEAGCRHRGRPGPRSSSAVRTPGGRATGGVRQSGVLSRPRPRVEGCQGPRFPRLNRQGATSPHHPSARGLGASASASRPFSSPFRLRNRWPVRPGQQPGGGGLETLPVPGPARLHPQVRLRACSLCVPTGSSSCCPTERPPSPPRLGTAPRGPPSRCGGFQSCLPRQTGCWVNAAQHQLSEHIAPPGKSQRQLPPPPDAPAAVAGAPGATLRAPPLTCSGHALCPADRAQMTAGPWGG